MISSYQDGGSSEISKRVNFAPDAAFDFRSLVHPNVAKSLKHYDQYITFSDVCQIENPYTPKHNETFLNGITLGPGVSQRVGSMIRIAYIECVYYAFSGDRPLQSEYHFGLHVDKYAQPFDFNDLYTLYFGNATFGINNGMFLRNPETYDRFAEIDQLMFHDISGEILGAAYKGVAVRPISFHPPIRREYVCNFPVYYGEGGEVVRNNLVINCMLFRRIAKFSNYTSTISNDAQVVIRVYYSDK